jgi:NADH-quinone oxidoreductase subunit N
MEPMHTSAAAPEIALLTGALVVLVADTFISDRQRNVTYALSIAVLAVVAGICGSLLADEAVVYAFGGMYVADSMTHLLKLVACLLTGLMLVNCSRCRCSSCSASW